MRKVKLVIAIVIAIILMIIIMMLLTMFLLKMRRKESYIESYITFNYNCNGVDYQQICELENNKINCEVERPSCEGYVFIGWYKSNEYASQIDLTQEFDGNEILYAKWETETEIDIDQTYKIFFDLNDGNESDSLVIHEIKYGEELPNIKETPSREGYTFMGWYDSRNGGNQYYNSQNIAIRKYDRIENVTLYAQWKINTLSIEYNGNGGTWGNNKSELYSVNESGSVVSKLNNKVYLLELNYGDKLIETGLIDYNGNWFKWNKEGYKINQGKEYFIENGKTKTEIDQSKVYTAVELANYGGCDLSKSNCKITVKVNWQKEENNDIQRESIFISKIEKKSAFVTVYAESDNPISGYFFTTSTEKPNGNEENWVLLKTNKLEIAKMPGKYYVYVKDSNNNISKSKTLEISIEDLYNDGPRSRDKSSTLLTTKLDVFLSNNNDSIANYNNFIAWSVRSAGLFTREGVITAGIAGANYLYIKYGVGIPYVSNVECFSQRYNVQFGANPDWGKKLNNCKDYDYGGLDCQAFVGWSVHNGGFKAEKTFSSYGNVVKNCLKYAEKTDGTKDYRICEKMKDYSTIKEMYKSAEIGDILVNNTHVMLIIENNINEEAIYVMESTTPLGLNKFSYNDLYKSNGLKYWAITKMSNYYEGNHACLKDSNGNIIPLPNAYEDRMSEFRTNCKA